MNTIWKPFLRRFILFFFGDILVYSASLELYVEHLRMTSELLRRNSLFAKLSKCSFGVKEVEYLGHAISEKEVTTDPSKISPMINWPQPKILKELKGFLELTGYCRKYVRNYRVIRKPLTELLKENSLKWCFSITLQNGMKQICNWNCYGNNKYIV